MALTGLHVACAFANNSEVRGLAIAVFRPPVWSETLPTAGTTTKSAPASPRPEAGDPLIGVFCTVDAYLVIGPNPDINNGPRYFLPARTVDTIALNPGDKVAWTPA